MQENAPCANYTKRIRNSSKKITILDYVTHFNGFLSKERGSSAADKPCLGADFEQEFGTDLYVSYFFETFSFLFRKIIVMFLNPNRISCRLRYSNPKSAENSGF